MRTERPVTCIVGAAGGIGTALCHRLAADGHHLVLCGRTEGPLVDLCRAVGGEALVLDASNVASVQEALTRVGQRHGRLDGAVNLAGSIVLKPAHATTEADWNSVVAQNLTSAFAVVRAAAPIMGGLGGGSIVLMSSAAARIGLANHEAIAAAKAGVIGLALSASATYAPRGVRVNVVAPGLVRTPLSRRIVDHDASRKASEAMHPLGRIGEPEEVAGAIAFLLDERQRWITGQTLGVDGGLGTVRSR